MPLNNHDMLISTPQRNEITGLILAGGQGRRMGGQDKGLMLASGRPLVHWTLERIRPQVANVGISANRHLSDYQRLNIPVWPDTTPDFDGPLAGIATGLAHCRTPYLAVVPCDAPCFPVDLVFRLAQGLAQAQAQAAVVCTPDKHANAQSMQPVFCLLHHSLRSSLQTFLAKGGRGVGQWMRQQALALVPFEDDQDFVGANTPQELEALALRLLNAPPCHNGPHTDTTLD